ncbi:MAG: hypothetical protein NTX56_05300 [Proteobacteria bacterium]|nr:hypothetical protein [Pseudomonadota bacterium]
MKTSKEILADHQQRIADLNEQADGLRDQIAQAHKTVSDTGTLADLVVRLRGEVERLRGMQYLGRGDAADLTDMVKKLTRAEIDAGNTRDQAIGAKAAAGMLEAEHDALQREAGRLSLLLPELLHAAYVEHALEAVPIYYGALQALADAHAELQGRCLAADAFASTTSAPRRPFTIGNNGVQPGFEAARPNLPGIENQSWSFDMRSGTSTAMTLATKTIGGVNPEKVW